MALSTGARQHEITTLRWEQPRAVSGLPTWLAWWIPPEVRKASSRHKASAQQGRFLVCNLAARSVIAAQIGKNRDVVFPSPKRDKAMYRINNHGWRGRVRRQG